MDGTFIANGWGRRRTNQFNAAHCKQWASMQIDEEWVGVEEGVVRQWYKYKYSANTNTDTVQIQIQKECKYNYKYRCSAMGRDTNWWRVSRRRGSGIWTKPLCLRCPTLPTNVILVWCWFWSWKILFYMFSDFCSRLSDLLLPKVPKFSQSCLGLWVAFSFSSLQLLALHRILFAIKTLTCIQILSRPHKIGVGPHIWKQTYRAAHTVGNSRKAKILLGRMQKFGSSVALWAIWVWVVWLTGGPRAKKTSEALSLHWSATSAFF